MDTTIKLHEALVARYSSILSHSNLQRLASETQHLSGIFLPSVPANYLNGNLKMMIVGKETRGWNRGIKRIESFTSIEPYIGDAIQYHASFQQKPAGRSKFRLFFQEATTTLTGKRHDSSDSIVWANLFCLSYKTKSPVQLSNSVFEEIKGLSQKLLLAQIEVLKPNVILFVTGSGYDKYIKAYFEIKDSRVIKPKALWSFKANGIQAYRTSHPQWEKGRVWRRQALGMALEYEV